MHMSPVTLLEYHAGLQEDTSHTGTRKSEKAWPAWATNNRLLISCAIPMLFSIKSWLWCRPTLLSFLFIRCNRQSALYPYLLFRPYSFLTQNPSSEMSSLNLYASLQKSRTVEFLGRESTATEDWSGRNSNKKVPVENRVIELYILLSWVVSSFFFRSSHSLFSSSYIVPGW